MKINGTIVKIAGVLALVGIVIAIAAVLTGGWGPGKAERKRYTFDAAAVKRLELRDTSSTVVVVGGSGSEVTVSLNRREAEDYHVSLSGSGDLVVERETQRNWLDTLSLDWEDSTLTVTVPSALEFDADLSTGSGSIELSDLSGLGGVSCRSTSGSVRGERLAVAGDCVLTATSGSVKAASVAVEGTLRLETGSGSIDAAHCGVEKDLELSCTSGSIRLEDTEAEGGVRAENTSGGIEADALRAGTIEFNTTSGSIRFDEMAGEDIRLHATSGSIRGSLSGDAADYLIEAHATSGSVDVPNSGSGDRRLSAGTTSGSIDIEIQ